MTPRLVVDKEVCGGAGLCAAMFPERFRLGDDGLAEALKSGLTSPEEIEAAEDVVGCCPTEAITLLGLDEDGNGGEDEGTAAGR
ncbi:ferredoxin [Streptomyces abikoensis]|uniref:ferredoxin n=1 Tax=Streptomyces abikoensis TaxID=97398 RepID=UPI003408244D